MMGDGRVVRWGIESPAGQRAREVLGLCAELGFALAGVADASPTRWGTELLEWLGAGKHGSMGYLAEQAAARLDPGLVLPGARSAIMVADFYAQRGEEDGALAAGAGRVARYARGADYHAVIKKRLHRLCDVLRERHPGAEFRAFTDTAPVMEREFAARAGLGWVGKHTLLIHPRFGSWMLLGGVLTTVELASGSSPVADHCGTCTRCIDACPTGAITPYSVDGSRCISYLTIERRGAIDAGFCEGIGDRVYGCDVCQEVCPHNSERENEGPGVREEYAPRRESFDLLAVLGWDEETRRREFAGTALKRATLAMMRRNAIIAAGNAARAGTLEAGLRAAMRERIAAIAADAGEDAVVRETAGAVLAAGL